jgi:hypothetical protein
MNDIYDIVSYSGAWKNPRARNFTALEGVIEE